MARRYVSTEAKCPYYRMEDARSITCEGVGPGWTIRLSKDGSSGNAKGYKRNYCYSWKWEECPIARGLTEKFR